MFTLDMSNKGWLKLLQVYQKVWLDEWELFFPQNGFILVSFLPAGIQWWMCIVSEISLEEILDPP